VRCALGSITIDHRGRLKVITAGEVVPCPLEAGGASGRIAASSDDRIVPAGPVAKAPGLAVCCRAGCDTSGAPAVASSRKWRLVLRSPYIKCTSPRSVYQFLPGGCLTVS
jgi:hypothetical protein